MCSQLINQLSLRLIRELDFVGDGWPVSSSDTELLLCVTTGVCSALPWSSMASIQVVQSNSHTLLMVLASACPVTPTTAATWKAHFARHHFMPLSPSPQEREGERERGGGKEGKREAHPERMLDKDGSRDILSTFISSGGGELCWILACYRQSHTLWSADGEHVKIKSTPPHFHLPHWKSGPYGAGCQLLIFYGN